MIHLFPVNILRSYKEYADLYNQPRITVSSINLRLQHKNRRPIV